MPLANRLVNASKTIEIIAGPNGSGKTTFAESFLLGAQKKQVFLNPDLIASGIAPGDFDKATFQAGRVLLGEVSSRLKRNESFAFESTLSGLTWARFLRQARSQDYRVIIYFLFLERVTQNLQRIRNRVALGGHDIPRDAVMRRQSRCFHNFWNVYRPLADDWLIFDNSSSRPRLLLTNENFERLSKKQQDRVETSFLKGRFRGIK